MFGCTQGLRVKALCVAGVVRWAYYCQLLRL